MANERTILRDVSGRTIGHIELLGTVQIINVVHNGRTVDQIIPRAGGRWYDREVNGKKIGEVVTDPRTWH